MDAARVLEDEMDEPERRTLPWRSVLPQHARPFTFDDLWDIPDDIPYRFELQDGCLIVSPAPSTRHQVVCFGVVSQLQAIAPDGWTAVMAPGFDPDEGSYREPDIAVCTRQAARRMETAYPEPDELLLLGEVVSPSTKTTDRITKPAEYAAQGIEFYLRVELSPSGALVHLHLFRNEQGIYVPAGETKTGGDPLRVPEPFTGAIDPSEL